MKKRIWIQFILLIIIAILPIITITIQSKHPTLNLMNHQNIDAFIITADIINYIIFIKLSIDIRIDEIIYQKTHLVLYSLICSTLLISRIISNIMSYQFANDQPIQLIINDNRHELIALFIIIYAGTILTLLTHPLFEKEKLNDLIKDVQPKSSQLNVYLKISIYYVLPIVTTLFILLKIITDGTFHIWLIIMIIPITPILNIILIPIIIIGAIKLTISILKLYQDIAKHIIQQYLAYHYINSQNHNNENL